MEFWIQASNPRYIASYSVEDASLSDAIETIFLLDTEDAFIVWNHLYIPLGYKYGFSCLIDDLTKLICTMLAEEMGKMVIEWPCNVFQAKWSVSWMKEDVQIDSLWVSVPGDLTELLNQSGSITLKKSTFLAEWRMPFEKILVALTASGYTPKNFKEILNLERLISSLPKGSYLYQE